MHKLKEIYLYTKEKQQARKTNMHEKIKKTREQNSKQLDGKAMNKNYLTKY
jgi:hypothetical protein